MSWDGSRPTLCSGTQNFLRWGSVPYLSHAWLLPPRRAAHTEPRAWEQWEASLLQEAPGGAPTGQGRSGHLQAPRAEAPQRSEAPSARHREAPRKANVDEGRKARTRRPRRRGADDRAVSTTSGTRGLRAAARMRAQVGPQTPVPWGAEPQRPRPARPPRPAHLDHALRRPRPS